MPTPTPGSQTSGSCTAGGLEVGSPDISLVSELHRLSKVELTARWRAVFKDQPPPGVKALLLRDLAWYQQTPRHGDVDAETARRLRDAMRQAADHTPPPKPEPNGARPSKSDQLQRRTLRPRPQLPTGTRLIRHWGGVDHEVLVQQDGQRFLFRGQTYRSLTPIAQAITGAHWSGPRFFNLTHPHPRKPRPRKK